MLRSYSVRAFVALAMLVLFYAFALGLACAFLGVAYLDVTSGRIHAKLVIILGCLGAMVLWSVVPRRAKWEDPGPRIAPAEHPRLFAVIEEVARRMGLGVPDEVYLIPEVNAFVTQRGGLLGFGTRRVMGIGVPLLAIQNVSQFKAVLAHEFGHYAGGETRLSGVIYATRSAMIRSIENLGDSWLQKPFLGFLKLYLRITHAIGRAQELFADEWSVRVAGKTAHVTSLPMEAKHGHGFHLFMREEVAPLTNMGFGLDNYFEGYRRFMRSTQWHRLAPRLEEVAHEEQSDPYDTHPSLKDRLAHADTVDAPDQPMDETPAYSLLSNPEAMERHFSETLRAPEARVISWDGVADAWAQLWTPMAQRLQARAEDLVAGALPEHVTTPRARETLALRADPALEGHLLPDRDEVITNAVFAYARAWLALLLAQAGWKWLTNPGEPLRLEKGEVHVDPGQVVDDLHKGLISAEAYATLLALCGVAAGARVSMTAEERAGKTRRQAEVTLVEEKKHVDVHSNLEHLLLPRCCPLCAGPAEYTVDVSIQVQRFVGEGPRLSFNLAACEHHKGDVHRAFTVPKFDEKTQDLTLRMSSREYARLIERCNA